MRTVLTIAGSDSCGGAGIQADIKTMTVNGVYAMSVITAMTAQNTLGITAIQESTPGFLKKQLDAVFEDIFPDAVKIGMIPSKELALVIAERLGFYKAKNVVIDPVMSATSGTSLMIDGTLKAITDELFPLATLITPNITEAEALTKFKITDRESMLRAAKLISDSCKCAVLLKGGHSGDYADDLLYEHGESRWFYGRRIDNPNTHGTGCTLSSAIASELAKGFDLAESVHRAKDYTAGAIAAMLELGRGNGPLQHNFDMNRI